MKKNLLLAGALLFTVAQVSAQKNPFTRHYTGKKNHALVQSILNKQSAGNTASKPTGIQQRVIAQGLTEIDGNDIYLDSFVYKYSGINGSKYDFNQVGYNQTFEPIYAPIRVDHRYDADPLNLLADTIINYSEGELYEIDRAYYRADKKIDSTHARMGSGLTDRSNNLVSYNSAGNIQTIYTLEDYSSSGLDTYSVHQYYYNTANTQLRADTVRMNVAPNTYFGYKYSYNSTGKLDTSYSTYMSLSNENKSRNIYDYYNDGKLRKITQQSFANGSWNTTWYDSLGYANGADYYTYWKETSIFFDGTQNVETYYLTEQYLGAANSPDSAWQYDWDEQNNVWIPVVKFAYEYNTFGNPVKLIATSVESGMPEPLGHLNFYYENYDDGLSIKPVAENKDFGVYPNPFSNEINIDWKGKQQSNATVRLVNVVGQDVYSTSMKLNAGKNHIDVPSLNSGNYILLIQDASGKTWSTKMVKK